MIEMTDKDGKKWLVDPRHAVKQKDHFRYSKDGITVIGQPGNRMTLQFGEGYKVVFNVTEAHSVMDGVERWLNHVE